MHLADWRSTLLALLLGGFLTLMASAAPAAAQVAGGIQVISNQNRINFPADLTIAMTAASDLEIVEVRLNYRSVGSEVWSYVYPSFEPALQVDTRFILVASGSNYIPPGTQIEYFFLIRDASGEVLQTQNRVLNYVDPRFPWEQVRVGPLTLFYHDAPPGRVGQVAQEVEITLGRVGEVLQLDSVRPVRGYIYNGYQEALPAFPVHSRAITEEEVFHGFAFPGSSVFLGIGLEPRLIVHEMSHLLLDQALESGGRSIPSWLDEGFATYIEPGSSPRSGRSLRDQGLPLRSMSEVTGTPEDIDVFYLKSESVVAYLIDEHGVESFQRFLGLLREGQTIDNALVEAYGFDIDGLEEDWSSSTKGRNAFAPGRKTPATPFVLFNTWFLGGLILVVMAAVLVRYLYRKVRPNTNDDGSSPWDY